MYLLAVLILSLSISCPAATIEGRVVGVSDGDTVTVLDTEDVQHKIRLAGIDAPEKSQPFGQRSKESLSELVFSKAVTVETGKNDRYGREVGKVLVGCVDANLAQVRKGFAWHYRAYAREQTVNDRRLYVDAEIVAKDARMGLWRDSDPVAPWVFRKAKRDEQETR